MQHTLNSGKVWLNISTRLGYLQEGQGVAGFFFPVLFTEASRRVVPHAFGKKYKRATAKVLSRVGEQHLHFKSPQSRQLRLASDLFFCHRCATTSFSSKRELLHRGWSGEDESPQQIQNLSNPRERARATVWEFSQHCVCHRDRLSNLFWA